MTLRLLADCGNTTVKLGLARGSQVMGYDRLPPDPAAFDRFLAGHPQDQISELILLPGSLANGAAVQSWWYDVRGRSEPPQGRTGTGSFHRQRDLPLRIVGQDLPLPDLGQYPGCGADRVLGGLAACLQERTSVICVDAGTATTFAAWRYDAAAPDPSRAVRFLGGLILPSAQSCLDGLAQAAPALPRVHPGSPEMAALQHGTRDALVAAMGIGYGPMVAACLLKLERETGIRQVVATGGNIPLLIDSKVITIAACHPALVLQGLALLAA